MSPGCFHAAAFLLPLLVTVGMMALLHVTPFGERTFLLHDMKRQYVAFYAEYRRILRGDGSLFYSLRRGLGGSVAELFAYYLSSPFLFLLPLFPEERLPEAVSLILALKTGACGLTCSIFLRGILLQESDDDGIAALLSQAVIIACGASFALSSFMVANMTNTMWTDAILLAPLLFLACFRLFQGRSPLPLAILTGLVLYTNYYIAFMIFLFEVIAVAAHLPQLRREHRLRLVPRFIVSSVLGAGLVSFMILPAYFPLTDSLRERAFAETGGLLTGLTTGQILSKLFSLAFDSLQVFEGSPHLFAGILLLLPLLLYFTDRALPLEERLRSLLLLAILWISFVLEPLNLLWHVGTQPSGYLYRYAFLFVLLFVTFAARELLQIIRRFSADSYATAEGHASSVESSEVRVPSAGGHALSNEGHTSSDEGHAPQATGPASTSANDNALTVRRNLYLRIIISCIVLAAVAAYVFTRYIPYLSSGKKVYNTALLCILAVSAIVLCRLSADRRRRIPAVCLAALLLFVHFADLGLNASVIFLQEDLQGISRSDYRAACARIPSQLVQLEEEKNKHGLFRIESLAPLEQNDALLFGYAGATYYSSDITDEARTFMRRLGYAYDEFSYSFIEDGTASASAALGIRYLLTAEGAPQERPALPMALRIPADASSGAPADTSDPFTFTQALLRAASGTDAELFLPAAITGLEDNAAEGTASVSTASSDAAQATAQVSTAAKLVRQFRVTPAADGRVYFCLTGVTEPRNLTVEAEGLAPLQYANYEHDHNLDLGEHSAGEDFVLTIRIYDDLPLTEQPVAVTEDTGALQALLQSLEDTGRSGGLFCRSGRDAANLYASFAANSGAPSDCLLLLPHSEEWEVTSGGKALATEPFFGLFTRVRMPQDAPAPQRIDLSFHPKGLRGGLLLSAASAVLLAFYILFLRRARADRPAAFEPYRSE